MVNGSHNSTQHTQLLQQITAVYLGLLAAMGTAGNSLVVVTVLRMPQTHRLTYILVGNISFIGLLHCLVTIPLHVTHMLLGHSLWTGIHTALCKAQAQINFGLVLCTLANSTAIAVCRYRTVTATHSVSTRTESRARIFKLLLFFWTVPLLVAFSATPFLGFNPLLGDCFFLHSNSSFWYTTLALATPALLSTVCMLTAYTLIIKKVRDSRLKIASLCKKLGGIGTDNMGNLSKEDRTASDSETVPVKLDKEVREESEGRPSTMAGIKVYTTMVSDDTVINIPSTSQLVGQLSTTNSLPEKQCDVTPWEGEDIPQPVCLPLSSQTDQVSGLDVTGLSAAKGSNKLSVPSRTISSLSRKSDDSVNGSMRNESGSSMSCWSSQMAVKTDSEGRGRRRLKREIRLTMHLFLAFVLFCLLYLPLCLVHQVHALHSMSKDVWLAFYTLALSFASNAWLIYALLNNEFRRAFRAICRGRRSF